MSRISWIAAAILGASLPAASAQEFAASAPCPCGATATSAGSPVPGTAAGVPYAETGFVAPGFAAPGASVSGPIHPYSYYVEFPAPARTYVPYGPTDTFTYRGQAYGHAYDRWTWPAMSNASPGVGRYYQLLH